MCKGGGRNAKGEWGEGGNKDVSGNIKVIQKIKGKYCH